MSVLTATASRTMAAKKKSPTGTATVSVKLPEDVVKIARIVAGYRGTALSDIIAQAALANLERWEQEEVARRAKEGGKVK